MRNLLTVFVLCVATTDSSCGFRSFFYRYQMVFRYAITITMPLSRNFSFRNLHSCKLEKELFWFLVVRMWMSASPTQRIASIVRSCYMQWSRNFAMHDVAKLRFSAVVVHGFGWFLPHPVDVFCKCSDLIIFFIESLNFRQQQSNSNHHTFNLRRSFLRTSL